MRRFSLLVVAILALPALASAQVPVCADCELGIWDDVNLNANHGNVTAGALKEIYVGIRLGAGETGVTGIEFSLAGMRQVEDGVLITGIDGVTDPLPNVILPAPGGTFAAPADTTASSTGAGGGNVAWAQCIAGTRALVKVSFISFSPLPTNKVFRILRRFPPTNPVDFTTQMFVRCDNPTFTTVSTPGGCYVANWDGITGTVNGCVVTTGVNESSWSGMKALYK